MLSRLCRVSRFSIRHVTHNVCFGLWHNQANNNPWCRNQTNDNRVARKVQNIIYDNSSSFRSGSVTHLKVNNYELQCSKCLVIFLTLPNNPQRKNNVKLGKKFKSSNWRDRVRLWIFSCYPHAFQWSLDLKLGRKFIDSK